MESPKAFASATLWHHPGLSFSFLQRGDKSNSPTTSKESFMVNNSGLKRDKQLVSHVEDINGSRCFSSSRARGKGSGRPTYVFFGTTVGVHTRVRLN
jgi:hypothetical protein